MKEPILADIGEVMKIAIDCIYACKRDDQLEHAFSIVESLPTREEGYEIFIDGFIYVFILLSLFI